jgi:glyoxylase-like metal-dependent hydrolase (beta-lactamase superfamily II)
VTSIYKPIKKSLVSIPRVRKSIRDLKIADVGLRSSQTKIQLDNKFRKVSKEVHMGRKRSIPIALVLTLLLTGVATLWATSTQAQKSVNAAGETALASERSYQQARHVLDDAIEAHGGLEALRGIKDFTLKEKGKVYARYQSPNAEPPYSSGPSEETLIVDNERNLLFNEVKTANGGFNNWGRTYIKNTEGQTIDMWSKTITPIVNPSLNNFRGQIRRLPPFILLEALDRAQTLRWVGEDEIGGRKQRVISVIRPDNQQLALSFDAQTNLLTQYDYLYADPIVGDAAIAQIYPAYRNVGKLKLPTGRILFNSGGVVQETEYTDIQINTRPAESLFEAPNTFEKLAAPPATPAPPAVSKVAEDVYFLQGLNGGTHNVMFVAFNDHVLVIEAPEQILYANNSATALAKIKETVPGKPIRYLVLTHHHSDHVGGFREYVSEGAAIVTTSINKRFLESITDRDVSLLPKSSLLRHHSLRVEAVNKKRVFQDDKHVVELYDVGPNPHADEILVVYLPKEKILFQGDLLSTAPNGSIPIAQDTTLRFAEKLEQLGLEVEKIYCVHGRVATPAELKSAVQRRKSSGLVVN